MNRQCPQFSTKLSEGSLEVLSRKEIDYLDLVLEQPKQQPVVATDPLTKQISIDMEPASSSESSRIAGGDAAHHEDGPPLHSIRYDTQLLPEAFREHRQSRRHRAREPFRLPHGG